MKTFLIFIFQLVFFLPAFSQLSLIKDIHSENVYHLVHNRTNGIVLKGTKAYFKATENGFSGLYETDATTGGTVRLSPADKNELNDELVSAGTFLAWRGPLAAGSGDTPWSRNGTANTPLGTTAFCQNLFVWNQAVYYSGYTAEEGFELWKTNGTTIGTVQLKNLPGSTSHLKPSNFTPFGKYLYFLSDAASSRCALWRTDGTTEGTLKITDIGWADQLTAAGALMYLTAPFSLLAYDVPVLWKSDGTADGTRQVKNINPSGNAYITELCEFNNSLYFKADNGVNGIELWKSDGTSAGTMMVRDIYPPGSSSGDIHNLKILGKIGNSFLFFSANDGINGNTLWKVDGTNGSAVFVNDINLTGLSGGPTGKGVAMNNKFYFPANDGVNGEELWRTDGTSEGTEFLGNINSGAKDAYPQFLTVYKNNILFVADNGSLGRELWKYTDTSYNPCDDLLTLSGNAASNTFKSKNSIFSTQTVNVTNNVSYQGTSFVQLNPGFSAGNGATFEANLKGCN